MNSNTLNYNYHAFLHLYYYTSIIRRHNRNSSDFFLEVKLVNTNNTCQGTVQVFHDGRWGTVCHNSWDIADGLVLCRELGCGGNAEPLTNAHFGTGEGPIWMDSLRCSGDESNLRNCQFDGWGNHQCIHAYDAGIICRGVSMSMHLQILSKKMYFSIKH